MPVDSKHPSYQKLIFQWKKCRDSVEGQEAIKSGGQLYLPQLEGQVDYEYESMKARALFYGAADRTVKALTGAVMRRPPRVQFPDVKSQAEPEKNFLDRVGARGEPFDLICKKIVEEVVTTGRLGVYVDSDTENDPGADPYLCIYFAENIINWGERNVRGRQILEFVVLLEDNPVRGASDNTDGFEYRRKERWRVLQLEDIDTPNPKLHVTVYERSDQSDDEDKEGMDTPDETDQGQQNFNMVFDAYPTFRGGKPVHYIPFRFINPSDNTTEIEKPPILDLVNVNLAHYINSCDLEHGLHFTALPTAWAAGFDPVSSRLRIGSSVCWVSENVQARAGFLEFSGNGLGAIEKAMNKKEKYMAILGARLLEEQKADSEAAAALRLRHSGEESVLQHIVRSIDEGLEQALHWLAEWMGEDTTGISCKLNDEFNPLGIDPMTMNILMNGVQSGELSWEVLFYNYQRGNIYPDGWTAEMEKLKIEAGRPLPPPVEVPEEVELAGTAKNPAGRVSSAGSGGEGADQGGAF